LDWARKATAGRHTWLLEQPAVTLLVLFSSRQAILCQGLPVWVIHVFPEELL
jgi:hypothetical protein|tara:strand:+ start:179 stop:334 length:156 start_codon:yes stop_codon:yes gene_type:complete